MRALETPPTEGEILDPLRRIGKTPHRQTVHIPSLDLFKTERDQWTRRFYDADKQGDPTTRRISEHTRKGLSAIIRGRVALAALGLLPPPTESGPREIQSNALSWYSEAAATLAHSRMYSLLAGTGKLALGFGEAGIIFDIDVRELQNGGVHFKPEYAENIGVDVPPDDTSRYYESDFIYLEVNKPATPTSSLIESYSHLSGGSFDTEQFATGRPFLKRPVWLEDAF